MSASMSYYGHDTDAFVVVASSESRLCVSRPVPEVLRKKLGRLAGPDSVRRVLVLSSPGPWDSLPTSSSPSMSAMAVLADGVDRCTCICMYIAYAYMLFIQTHIHIFGYIQTCRCSRVNLRVYISLYINLYIYIHTCRHVRM